jgi:uncharacterized membrane protein HdeD (DUF308 family)
MSYAPYRGLLGVGAEELRTNWGWFVVFGILLVILGVVCVVYAAVATIFWVEFFAAMLMVGGALSIPHAFLRRRWGGFFLDLLAGILYLVFGFAILVRPEAGAIGFTLLIALALIIGGTFRLAVGFMAPLHHRIWVILSGLVTLILGIMIWNRWPWSSAWIIGLFIGIDLLFYGWSLVMLGVTARNIPGAMAGPDWRDSGAAGGPTPGAEGHVFRPPSAPPAGP